MSSEDLSAKNKPKGRPNLSQRPSNLNPRQEINADGAVIIPVQIIADASLTSDNPSAINAWISEALPDDVKITCVRPQGKRKLLVYGATERDFNVLMKPDKWKKPIATPWIPQQHTLDATAVIRQVDHVIGPELIENRMHECGYKPIHVSRLKTGEDGHVTKSVKIVLSTADDRDRLVREGFKFGHIKYDVVPYKRPLKVIQCFFCQEFGHVSGRCSGSQKCLRCGGAHRHEEEGACQVRKGETTGLKCPNCQGPHASNYALCPVRIAYVEKLRNGRGKNPQSYAAAASVAKPEVIVISQQSETTSAQPAPEVPTAFLDSLLEKVTTFLETKITEIMSSIMQRCLKEMEKRLSLTYRPEDTTSTSLNDKTSSFHSASGHSPPASGSHTSLRDFNPVLTGSPQTQHNLRPSTGMLLPSNRNQYAVMGNADPNFVQLQTLNSPQHVSSPHSQSGESNPMWVDEINAINTLNQDNGSS